MRKYFKIGAYVFGGLLLGSALFAPAFIETIQPGFVGVVYSPNGGIKKETLQQGWHPVMPFDKVTSYPIKRRTIQYDNLVVPTSDGKNVTISITYNYYITNDKVTHVFNTFGPIDVENIENGYLKSRLSDSARKTLSKFTVIDLFGQKISEASNNILEKFKEDVKKDGFIIEDITLGAPQPDAKTQEAIDLRVKANQELERKQTELDIAKREADIKETQALGEANRLRIEAEGKSKANMLLQQSITKELIQYELVKQLPNINFPKVMGGNNLLQMPQSLLEDKNGK